MGIGIGGVGCYEWACVVIVHWIEAEMMIATRGCCVWKIRIQHTPGLVSELARSALKFFLAEPRRVNAAENYYDGNRAAQGEDSITELAHVVAPDGQTIISHGVAHHRNTMAASAIGPPLASTSATSSAQAE